MGLVVRKKTLYCKHRVFSFEIFADISVGWHFKNNTISTIRVDLVDNDFCPSHHYNTVPTITSPPPPPTSHTMGNIFTRKFLFYSKINDKNMHSQIYFISFFSVFYLSLYNEKFGAQIFPMF